MKSLSVVWEDEENNRQVELSVEYQRAAGNATAEICGIIPRQITFHCPHTGRAERQIRVWTDGGRRLLARQFQQSAQFAELHRRITESRKDDVLVG